MDILCLTFSLNYHEIFYNPFNGMVKWGMNFSGTGGEVECTFVDQRRLVNYVVSVVTAKIMFAPSSADIT